jgi:hypothetical protein
MRAMPLPPHRLAALLLLAAGLLPRLGAQGLVPAGSINAAAASGPWLVLAPDDPAVLKFATGVRDNKLGRIVGEPTGSAPSSFGDILTLSLPNCGCSYTLSFKRWVRPDATLDPADALAPDVPVPRTSTSVVEDSDPVLDWLRGR